MPIIGTTTFIKTSAILYLGAVPVNNLLLRRGQTLEVQIQEEVGFKKKFSVYSY